MLAARIFAASARRASSGCARNCCWYAGSRTCWRNSWYGTSSTHSSSPCVSSKVRPNAVTAHGSASSRAPVAAANSAPIRKSRLPCCSQTGTRAAVAAMAAVQRASNGRVRASSPTHTSKMSPSRKTASARVEAM